MCQKSKDHRNLSRMSQSSSTPLILITTIIGSILSLKQTKVSKSNVVMVVELIRHGSRAPISSVIPQPWIQEAGLGELTNPGKRMQYLLGLNTRQRYPTLFPKTQKTLKMNEFWMFSTPYNRTIESAISHTLGLFEGGMNSSDTLPFKNNSDSRFFPPQMLPPKNQPLFDLKTINFSTPLPFGFQPFPVYTTFPQDEFLLMDGCTNVWKQNYASMSEFNDKNLTSSKKFNQRYQELLKKLNLSEKWISKNWGNLNLFLKSTRICDFVVMSILNNNTFEIGFGSDSYYFCLNVLGAIEETDFAKPGSAEAFVTPSLRQIGQFFALKLYSYVFFGQK